MFSPRKCCQRWAKNQTGHRTLQAAGCGLHSQLEEEGGTKTGTARLEPTSTVTGHWMSDTMGLPAENDWEGVGAEQGTVPGSVWRQEDAAPGPHLARHRCPWICKQCPRSSSGVHRRPLRWGLRKRVIPEASAPSPQNSNACWNWPGHESHQGYQIKSSPLHRREIQRPSDTGALGHHILPWSKIQDKLHKWREFPIHQRQSEDGNGTGGTKGKLSFFFVVSK